MVDSNDFSADVLQSERAQQEIERQSAAPRTLTEMRNAQMMENFRTETTPTLKTWYERKLMELESNQAEMTVEALKAKYPDVEWSQPEKPVIADAIASDRRHAKAVEEFIALGGGLSLWEQLKAGALPAIVDPINIIAGVTGEAAVGKLAAKTGFAAKNFFGRKAIQTFAGEIVGNYAADIPAYALRKDLQQDPDFSSMLIGSTAGAALATGISLGAGAMKEKYHASKVIAAEERGLNPPPPPSSSPDIDGDAPPNGFKKPFQELAHPSEVAFYTNSPDGSTPGIGTHSIFDGYELTDNSLVTNNRGSYNAALIAEKANLLDLRKELPEDVVTKIVTSLDSKIKPKRGESAKQFFHRLDVEHAAGNIDDNFAQVVKRTLIESGYAGVRDVHTVGGSPSHNKVLLFDQGQALVREGYKQDPNMTAGYNTDAMLDEHRSWEAEQRNKQSYDKHAMDLLEQVSSKPHWKPEEVQAFVHENQIKNAAQLKQTLKAIEQESKQLELDLETQGKLFETGEMPKPEEPKVTLSAKASEEFAALKKSVQPEVREQLPLGPGEEQPKLFTEEELGTPKLVKDELGIPVNEAQMEFEDLLPQRQLGIMSDEEAAKYLTTRTRLTNLAQAMGVKHIVFAPKAIKSYSQSRIGYLEIPKEDAWIFEGIKENGVMKYPLQSSSTEMIFAHELGHHASLEKMTKDFHAEFSAKERKLIESTKDFKELPTELRKRYISAHNKARDAFNKKVEAFPGLEELRKFSKQWKPDLWKAAPHHTNKPEEIVADVFAAVLLGDKDIDFVKPLLDHLGLTIEEARLDKLPPKKAPFVISQDTAAEIKKLATAKEAKATELKNQRVAKKKVENATETAKTLQSEADKRYQAKLQKIKELSNIADCVIGSTV